MRLLKNVYSGIPRRYVVWDFVFIIIWSYLNAQYIGILSRLTTTILEGQLSNLPKTILFYTGYLVFWELTEYFGDVFDILAQVEIGNSGSKKFLTEIYKLKPSVIKEYNTGYLNGLANKYINQKCSAFGSMTIALPLSVIYIVYSIWQMWSFHYIYGLALTLCVLIAVAFRFSSRRMVEELGNDLTEKESNRDKRLIDTISNIGTVQKLDGIDYMNKKLDDECVNCTKSAKKFIIFNEISFAGYKLIVYLFLPVACLIYYLNPDLVEDSNSLFSFLAVVSVQLVHISKEIAASLLDTMKFNATCKKIDSILNDDNNREDKVSMDNFESAEIKDVVYQYFNKDKQVTTTVNIPYFSINKGDKVCIYGESGQGKTTTINILSGEIQTGKVLINGKETTKLLDCVYIAQDNSIMDMSLRDNLTLGNTNITDEEVIQLIKDCGLYEWFSRQDNGLDTPLGERGVFVSTGQRQRLNLIRGLLIKDKEVYLLDEPTSNVDDETEVHMINTINEYLKHKTVVIVTHRPGIKAICNRAYKFENGVCKEDI